MCCCLFPDAGFLIIDESMKCPDGCGRVTGYGQSNLIVVVDRKRRQNCSSCFRVAGLGQVAHVVNH